jgi:predicted methyltransferase
MHFAASYQVMSERIFIPSNIHRLEDPERQAWLPPQDVIRLLNLTSGMSIADIGAGSGFFALPFARAIEPGGRLFALIYSLVHACSFRCSSTCCKHRRKKSISNAWRPTLRSSSANRPSSARRCPFPANALTP